MRTANRGFTLIEVIMVIVLIGAVAAIALPRIGVSRYQANAAARAVTGTLSYAQRMALSQQTNINVAFDAARRGMRVHEDRDNDLNMDPGERVTFTPLADGITFGRGTAAARAFGGADIQLTRQQDGLPVLIFRRDGTLSEEGGIYLSTMAGLAAGRGDRRARGGLHPRHRPRDLVHLCDRGLEAGGLMQRRGFTLIEIMVAVVVLAAVLLGAGQFTARFIHTTAISQVTTVASDVATERMEMITTDPSYTTLGARWAGTTTGFPGYAAMTMTTTLQRITGNAPRRDYTVVTVQVTEPTLQNPVRLTSIVGQP